MKPKTITVSVEILRPIEKVWEAWNSPKDIQQWNVPFDDWHCPFAENDLREGKKFNYRMESLDGEEGFVYKGTYLKILSRRRIETVQEDGRESIIEFIATEENSLIKETFEPEAKTPLEVQTEFCRSVLNRFKKYIELK